MKSLSAFFSNLTTGKWIMVLLSPVISLLISMKAALLGLLLLIIIDLITGIRKGLHVKKIPFNPLKVVFWKSIKSYLLRKTWKKSYEYAFGIIAIVVLEALILGVTPITLMDKVFTISELSVLIPSAVEVWSIFENFEAVSGNNILKRMKGFLPAPLQKLFKGNKDVENGV